jgi:beta-1,4-mannosyl-glycoprotein beta-1,4-N-acetylglucosaminyltransferase
MTKVYDCFTFFNELDLLEFRLSLLEDVVDKFVICESNLTHSGKTKPYYYHENKSRFSRWESKIIHIPIEQSVEGFEFKKVSSYDPTNGPFLLEYQHRDGFQYIHEQLSDTDLVFMGDLDEFPDPDIVKKIYESEVLLSSNMEALSMSMRFHYYYMNCQVESHDSMWQGTVITSGKSFRNRRPQYFRDNRNNFNRIQCGWHFSYLGGVESIKRKIQSIAHVEFDRPEITSEENIKTAIEKGVDVLNRPGINYNLVSLSNYPEFLQRLMVKYPQFIKDVS